MQQRVSNELRETGATKIGVDKWPLQSLLSLLRTPEPQAAMPTGRADEAFRIGVERAHPIIRIAHKSKGKIVRPNSFTHYRSDLRRPRMLPQPELGTVMRTDLFTILSSATDHIIPTDRRGNGMRNTGAAGLWNMNEDETLAIGYDHKSLTSQPSKAADFQHEHMNQLAPESKGPNDGSSFKDQSGSVVMVPLPVQLTPGGEIARQGLPLATS